MLNDLQKTIVSITVQILIGYLPRLYDIDGTLYIYDYLRERKQGARGGVITSRISNSIGVPQGSVYGHFCFYPKKI